MRKMNGIIAFAVLLLYAMPLQAQFLRQIGKKLKEKVEQVSNSVSPTETSREVKLGEPKGPLDTLSVRPVYQLMRVTPRTKFIHIPNLSKVSDMHEGIFGVVCNSYDWGFMNKEGELIFETKWRNPTGKDADVRFDRGAVIMAEKQASGNVNQLYILYSNGTQRKLPSTYTKPTHFVDGVARVLKRSPQQSGGTYVYIDISGKEVMSNLNESVKYGMVAVERVGCLSDGLRAHYWVEKKKWGYIDEKGKVIIQPAYEVARDFSEGRAVVAEVKGYSVSYSVIDTSGKVIFKTPSTTMVSDCTNGLIIVSDTENGVDNVYNRDGKLLKSFKFVTPFYKGYAWASELSSETGPLAASQNMVAINTDFRVVNRLGLSFLDRRPDNFYGFTIGESGFVTMKENGHAGIYLPEGTLIARSAREGSIGSMTEDMLACVDLESYDSQKLGFVNPDGEFVLFFKTEQTQLASPTTIYNNPDNPFSPKDNRGKTCDALYVCEWNWVTPPVPDPPVEIGKIEKYTVSVTASPVEGGTVSGGGVYEPGQEFTIAAHPVKGWGLASISSGESYFATTSVPFTRTMPANDLSFVAHFFKRPEVQSPSNRIVAQGIHTVEQDGVYKGELAVYLEQSDKKDIVTPYGEYTFGFLTVFLDSDKVIEATLPELGMLKFKSFFAPMRICGQMIENDTTYLVVEGGQMMAGGVEFGTANPLFSMFYNFIMDFQGNQLASLNKGYYRIQMKETDKGEIILGKMQRYHIERGWLSNDDEAFKTRMTCTDRILMTRDKNVSIPAYLFEGVILKMSEVRKVDWVPSSSWFKDQSTAISQRDKLLKSYAAYRSDLDSYWSSDK